MTATTPYVTAPTSPADLPPSRWHVWLPVAAWLVGGTLAVAGVGAAGSAAPAEGEGGWWPVYAFLLVAGLLALAALPLLVAVVLSLRATRDHRATGVLVLGVGTAATGTLVVGGLLWVTPEVFWESTDAGLALASASYVAAGVVLWSPLLVELRRRSRAQAGESREASARSAAR
ncbi:hypothetical protein [Nocardioides litoris]|uniref:hypothetical protein n=1 Tax=Nocardioides litoris TaxID=1926648 RepID=UPI0011241D58|nr:hypothetical protein [Nocardioides litoris]